MQPIMQGVEMLNANINQIVWGPLMLIFLSGIGIYLSFRTDFPQARHFGHICKHTIGTLFKKRTARKKGEITPFQAVSTALAGTIGVGNIVGVATAITAGGPGAVFWMWVSAFFGMMTKYTEVLLAVRYRRRRADGSFTGGPMVYLADGLHFKKLAALFAVLCVLASLGIGNMTQANAISQAAQALWGAPAQLTGLVAMGIVAFVMLGGIGRIANVAEKIVPLMALFYIAGCVAALAIYGEQLPSAFTQIFQGAFDLRAAGGGVAGYAVARAIRYGFSRGVFSNEAGLGSAPIVHASAQTDNPVRQGFWGMIEVFFDTLVMCTMTALVIIASGLWERAGMDGLVLTAAAFTKALGPMGGSFVSIGVIFFALSTIFGWSVYGQRCIEYLFPRTPRMAQGYRIGYVALVFAGAVMELQMVWNISDTLNGLMAIPNLIGVVGLSGVAIRMTRDYFDHLR
ncbi:sodium:alanine symporter family protein [Christensenellaceae bacterium NSJ-44]|uniref:Sodium:alanine symporter family protein n=1 Tax=Luoshenia tenuis TaxID=2763654 RepID=A0A926D0M8_9FIRM|nr:sodium:alanine symporter family protein [Luoshenia tenuis]MBC8530185.1 sodium:alanine symporter family protein [Luoshenia tenuis]